MSKITSSVLRHIKEEHTKPLPKWIFVLKNMVIWLLTLISILAASLFLGSLLSDLIRAEWDLMPWWPGKGIGFLQDTITGIWIFGLFVALSGSILFFKYTRRGYRYGVIVIASILIVTSAVTAFSLLPTPLPEFLHEWHETQMPHPINISRFHNPDEGRLVGEITRIENDTAYMDAIDGKKWELWFFDNLFIPKNTTVLVFGEKMDESTFAVLYTRFLAPDNFMQESFRPIRITR